MKQSLQLRTTQQLALTPQLQQSIRLLQLSSLDLHQELEQILQDNPLLELLNDPIDTAIRLLPDGALSSYSQSSSSSANGNESDDTSHSSANTEHDAAEHDYQDDHHDGSSIWDEAKHHRANQDDDDEGNAQLETIEASLREHLLDQANLSTRTQRDAALLSLLIEALDENGYLDESLEQILESLPKELNVELDDLVFALNFLQSLEPAGVGARSVSECLALQIKRLPHVPLVTRRLALTLVRDYLPEMARHDFSKIKKAIDCDDQELREAQEVIQHCQPHPGQCFSKERIAFVTPDVIVTKTKEGWRAELNQHVIPKLQVNSLYANLLAQHNAQHKSTGSLQTQLQEARWLIRNIHQRYDTILRVSQAIVDRQRNFFAHGAIAMRPLVLREIADTLELHESTISRVTTQKYMLTPHGIVELKYFFGSHIATDAGGEASSTAIKALIKQLIGEENQTNPLSDSKIASILDEQGMVVARRTVAKYREALKIPPVNLRKVL